MSLRWLRGLRGRLLAALVLTSLLTLAATAVALVGPLAQRLRERSVENLRAATVTERPRFERALRRPADQRPGALASQGFALRERADARVLVTRRYVPDFQFDTNLGANTRELLRVALRARRLTETQVEVKGDEVVVATRLFDGDDPAWVLVTQRRLTDVTTAVEQVRNALLASAAVGLVVAILLSLAISSTLLRRLGRLRDAALRITAEGAATAPRPSRDTSRDEVGDLARTLAGMQDALRREELARRSFVATASHELRTPLTMLQGTMELLEEDLGGGRLDVEDAKRQVAGARRELRRLSSLAGELLDLSRLDAQVPLRSEPVPLGEMARAVAAEFALRASAQDVALEVLTPAEEEAWATGDPDAVARIVRILVDNALRHGPPGAPIAIAAGAHGRTAIEVADRGAGVLPQDRDRIFERFYRSADASEASGFGLGLAIGRGLAEQMGGTLDLISGDGAGARFVLDLPAAPRPEGVSPPA